MKKFWKTVAFLGTAALAVTGGICLIRKFFNPDEELEDFDDDDLFEEDEDDTDEVEAFDNDAEIFEDEAKEAPAEEKSEAEPAEKEAEEETEEEATEEQDFYDMNPRHGTPCRGFCVNQVLKIIFIECACIKARNLIPVA